MFVSAGEVSVKVRKRPQSVPGPRKKRHAGTFWGLFRARAGEITASQTLRGGFWRGLRPWSCRQWVRGSPYLRR